MADAAAKAISRGALRAIFEPGVGRPVDQPILQCVQIKAMSSKGSDQPERYRVIFNDIDNYIQSMLASKLNYLVTDGILKRGNIVRLTEFQPNTVKDKRILIIVNLEVLGEYGELEKIGEPLTIDVKQETTSAQPTAVSANGFYGNRPAQQESTTSLPSRPNYNSASDGSHGNLYPLEALSPFAHRWTIKVRVTHKTEIKSWHNKNGEGRLFSVHLLDESGEMRATAFSTSNDQFDSLYELLQEGSVYYISTPCVVKHAKKQFSQLNSEYELTFERDTRVEKAEDQASVPQVKYNFTNIGDLASVEKDTTIDTIGILKEVGEVSQITSKTTSKPYDKRDLTLVDNTLHSVRLTIWGNQATNFDAPVESVIAFKGVKVSDFGGRSLSLLSSGSMAISPDIDEAHKLKGWYDAQGHADQFSTHAALGTGSTSTRKDLYKTIDDIREEKLGMNPEQADFFTIKATIVYIKDTVAYPACQSADCNKKVVEIDEAQWRCERCDKTWDKPQYRYIMTVNISDHTGQLFLNVFDNEGRIIMDRSADEVEEIKQNGDKTAFEAIRQEAMCKSYIFRCKAKIDTYNEKQMVRYQVMNLSPLNFKSESLKLVELLKQYKMDDNSLFVH